VAIGGEYRRETVNQKVDALSQAGAFAIGNPKAFAGAYSVKEGFFETVVPLFKDSRLLGSADFNGAVRVTDYSTSGEQTTWKLGATWHLTHDLLLRATRSRDIRAPNLSELFSSSVLTFATIVDPSTGTQVTVRSPTSGNTALKPERADTFTAGFSYQPGWLRGFRASVDYYDINVQGAISTLAAQDILTRCASGNTSLCSLVLRSGSTLTEVDRPYINLARTITRGVDIETSYNRRVGHGDLGLRFLATYVANLITDDGVTRVDRAGDTGTGNSGLPHWRWDATATYNIGPVTAFVEGRYVGGGVQNATYTATSINDNHMNGQFLLNSSWTFDIRKGEKGNAQFFVSGNNLLNQAPPISPQAFIFTYPTNSSLYDVIGRTFSIGLRFHY
jgi:outer membrane receptor protein involved in Fe transport